MQTNTRTKNFTFSITIADYLASKIVADLHRLQSYYNAPSDTKLEAYRQELYELLRLGYLAEVEYGFKRSGQRVLSLHYVFRTDGTLADNHAGGVPPRLDISCASWFSFLSKNDAWWELSQEERTRIEKSLPIQRIAATAPRGDHGYWQEDRSYAYDGAGTARRVFRPYPRSTQ